MSTSPTLGTTFEQAQIASRAQDMAQAVYERARISVTAADNARHSCYTSDSTTEAERAHRQEVFEIERAFAARAKESLDEAQRLNQEKQQALAAALNSQSGERGCNASCGLGCSC